MQETQEMQIQSLGWEDPLEEGTATYSRVHEITKNQTGLKQLNMTLTWLNMTSDLTTRAIWCWLYTVKNPHITYRWPSISVVQHPRIQPVRTVSCCNIYYWKKFTFKWAWAVQTYVLQRSAVFEAGRKASRVGGRDLSRQLNWPCFMKSQVVLWSQHNVDIKATKPSW